MHMSQEQPLIKRQEDIAISTLNEPKRQTKGTIALISAADIRRTLYHLREPGEIVEIRVFKRNTKRIFSGYFDDVDQLVAQVTKHSGNVKGVFFTINRVDSTLLARRKNALGDGGDATADKDVTRRTTLFADFDLARPSGISSTDAEHEAAIETAIQVQRWLRTLEFPELMVADSGNGAHLNGRIDLPNDDESRDLIKQCLKAIEAHVSTQLTPPHQGRSGDL